MTRVIKGNPLPADPADVAKEEERRRRNADNETLQRNIKAAVSTEHQRLRNEIAGEIAALGRIKKGRGSVEARRGNYNRAYDRLERAARVLFDATGVPVAIPERDPPAEVVSVRMVNVGLEPSKPYTETRGKSPDGTGLAPVIPGSAADNGWLK